MRKFIWVTGSHTIRMIIWFAIISVPIALLISSGCTAVGNTVKVDETAAAGLRSEIKIYDSTMLRGLKYETIQSIHATSCTDRKDAIDQLRYLAHSAGANGITKIDCNRLLGATLGANCLSSVICDALAIKVLSETVNKPEERQVISYGAGFILGNLSLVVTNYYAVGESEDIEIIFPGNQMIKGKIIKRDKENDLAIISFDEFRKEPVGFHIFPSYKIRSGQDIYAIGYPAVMRLGENPVITKAVIETTDGFGGDSRHFKMTAQTNPGGSGGPVLDTQGRVIGIMTPTLNAIYSTRAKGKVPEGTYFAIKSNLLLNLYPETATLINTENNESLSVEKIYETYSNSVVVVLAR